MFIGTLEPRKNVGALLDAYEQLLSRPAQAGRYGDHLPELVLAGKATPAARPWLDRLEHPPLRGASATSATSTPTAAARCTKARGCWCCRRSRGFGLPVLEAMATGVPVVAANRGALPEVVGGAGLLVDPESPEDLAAAIEKILHDDEFAAACASKGLARAREFQWAATARLVSDVYHAAIEHKRCASA